MEDTAGVQETLKKLKQIGVRLAIDDFGTGHSCLSYLRQFPIDVLKIDRSFVADLGLSEDGTAICGLVLSIAHCLGLEVVAEGVETEAQLKYLKQHGCNLVQGYYYSMPAYPPELAGVIDRYGCTTGKFMMAETRVTTVATAGAGNAR
jgi:EAL domain-containing protein (putative c-di-GMP-specific phosphodiesterase class I)